MKRCITLLFVAGLAMAANRTGVFTGTVTDTMCGKDHGMMKIKPDAKCVQDCVKSGTYKYALLDEKNNVYPFHDQALPTKFAGQKVKVKGTLYEKTKILKVDSIEPGR